MRYQEYYHDPKRELEMVFCTLLEDATGIKFHPNKGDQEVMPPYGAVVCENMRPINGGVPPRGYLCNVKVMYISHIDEVDAQEHGANLVKVQEAITTLPKNDPDTCTVPKAELYGYEVSEKAVLDYYNELDTLAREMDHFRLHTEDPIAFARGLRQALFSVFNLNYPRFEKFKKLADAYEFIPGDGVVDAKISEASKDKYIRDRARIILSGCYLEDVSTHSDQQAFTDIFSLTVGAHEYCG